METLTIEISKEQLALLMLMSREMLYQWDEDESDAIIMEDYELPKEDLEKLFDGIQDVLDANPADYKTETFNLID